MERFFTHPKTLLSKREGPLGLYIDELAEQLSQQGYSRQWARRRLQLVAELSHWLRRQNLAAADLSLTHLENFLRFRARSRRRRPDDAAGLKAFLDSLHQKGLVLDRVELVEKTPIDELQGEFTLYLRQERVLAPSTVISYSSFAKQLLTYRFGIGAIDLSLLSAADVVGFVQLRASSLARKTAKLLTTALRSFLQFARYRDCIRVDLAACVPCVADWSAASLPKSLPLKHVKGVLASCNRKTAIGRRDYAILLLLARLGLRAGEVVSLALEDIDWEAGYLTVRGKGDRRAPLPLPPDVGKAIAAYLKYGRPRSASRCVFLRGRAPSSSFKSSPAVGSVVRHALARAESTVFGKVRISFDTHWLPRCYVRAHRCVKSVTFYAIVILKLLPSMPRWISSPYEHWGFPGREVHDEHSPEGFARLPHYATCSRIQTARCRRGFAGFCFLLRAQATLPYQLSTSTAVGPETYRCSASTLGSAIGLCSWLRPLPECDGSQDRDSAIGSVALSSQTGSTLFVYRT